jgi:hypothetical protein
MTKISEFLDHLRAQGIDIQVRRLGTLWVLPELIEWSSREDVIKFLGLRTQIVRCLVYHEDRQIDPKRYEYELRKLKLAGPKVKRIDYELALGTLDGDAAAADQAESERIERSHRRQVAALTGE